jgi:hypothetical protein
MKFLFPILVALAAIAAHSQEPTPAKQDSKAVTQKSTARGTSDRPLVITILPNESDKKETGRREAERREKAASDNNLVYWTRVLAALALLQFFALAFHAYIFRRQAKSLGASVEETNRATTLATNTAQADLRAYVAVDDIYFPWVPTTNFEDRASITDQIVRIRVKNFGKTPATNITIRISGIKAAGPEFPRVFGPKDYKGPKPMLSPTQQYTTRVPPDRFTFDPEYPKDSDGKEPFIFGAILYQDIYERWWLHHFCYNYDTKPGTRNRFIPHARYNYEREYKTEQQALDSLSYS